MNSKWQNQLNFFRTLTVRRVWNMMKVYLSFHLSKATKKPIQWGMPFSISVEPTTSCNLRCPECPSGLRSFTRPTGMLQTETFRTIIDQVHPHVNYLTFYFQGEPYLHKEFLEMVKYARAKKIYTATSTNAHFLNDPMARKTVESGIDRLIISIDGTTQETYKQYRVGGKLEKVIVGTKNVVKWKKKLNSTTPYIIFQFLVVKPNEHQVEDVKVMARDLGVDEVILKTAQVYDYEQGNPLIPENEKYSRYKKQEDGTYVIKNVLENSCWKLWHSCVVTWDGKIVPCCFDKDAQYQLGDLKNTSFHDIWWSEAYYDFRTKLTKSRKEIDICMNCSEGCEVNMKYDF